MLVFSACYIFDYTGNSLNLRIRLLVSPGSAKTISIRALPHNLPKVADNSGEEVLKQKEKEIHESNRNSQKNRRSRQSRDTQGDTAHHAYPRRRPVTNDIGTVAAFQLHYERSGQTAGVGVVHSDEESSY